MAVRTRAEILETMGTLLGNDPNDEALSFIEDVSDTLTDFEQKTAPNGVNWEEKYRENDRAWRQRYRDRFFNKGDDDDDVDPIEDKPKIYTYESLFKED